MAIVQLDKVSVEFAVYSSSGRALKNELLRRAIGGRVQRSPTDDITAVRALDQVSFSVQPGERVGVIGSNGAGKTTLLRVLGRIYPPTSGTATITGKVASLIDLSMGMDPEATGIENIYIKATLLGLKRREIAALVPEIVEFCELGDYINLPVRMYSSGMTLRLAFAVSTAVRPDVVIFDEVIGVGDASFLQKAKQRVDRLIDRANIVFVSSHDLTVIERYCTRVLMLERGTLVDDGPPERIAAAYLARLGQAPR